MSTRTRAVGVATICAGVLIAAAACGSGDEKEVARASATAPGDKSGQAEAGAGEAETGKGETGADPGVDPLAGESYCDTLERLIEYSRGAYGLNDDGTVDGAVFSERLDTIGQTFTRLAEQASGQPVQAWTDLAGAAEEADNVLRAANYNVNSQTVLLELSELAAATNEKLPVATATAPDECGLDPRELSGIA